MREWTPPTRANSHHSSMQDSSKEGEGPSLWEVCPPALCTSCSAACRHASESCHSDGLTRDRCCRHTRHAGQLRHAERAAGRQVGCLWLPQDCWDHLPRVSKHPWGTPVLPACRAGLGGLPTSASQQPAAQARFGGGAFGQGLQQVRWRAAPGSPYI